MEAGGVFASGEVGFAMDFGGVEEIALSSITHTTTTTPFPIFATTTTTTTSTTTTTFGVINQSVIRIVGGPASASSQNGNSKLLGSYYQFIRQPIFLSSILKTVGL